MEPITATTELEATNQLLKAVGETPVSSLDDLGFTDAAIARDTLRTKHREVLMKGWYFNRDDDTVFTPGADGMAVLPPNILAVLPSTQESRRILPRDGKLYNATDRTYTFDVGSEPIVTLVWGFDFETLPESARRYITVSAATQFQAQYQGSEQSYGFTKDDEKFALMVLMDEERLYEARGNMFNDNATVSETWTR